jgi:hypothetical protein
MDRIRNVYDDHQDREQQQARQQGYRSALYETRNALLATALATHQQWREELQVSGPDGKQEAIHAKYAARLQGLNDAFAVLRQADPGITTQLDVEQFQRSATERAQAERQERSLAANRTDRGYDYGVSY